MAFRSQKTSGTILMLVVAALTARAEVSLSVRHAHLRKSAQGELRITEKGIAFREAGKQQDHARDWAFDEIQQLYISPHLIRVLTYEDVRWKLGADREYEFLQLPDGAAASISDAVNGRMDPRRVVSALPDVVVAPVWQAKAKLLQRIIGSDGVLAVGEDSVVFKSERPNASRTWRFGQIESISSSGPFDLIITTFERDASRFAERRDYRFQLKTELPEERYNALWRLLNESRIKQSSENIQEREHHK